jgi:hypothetical protein
MTADEKSAYAHTFPVHVGVDTGKSFHKLVARGADGRRTKALTVPVSRAGFDAADAYLATLFPSVPRERILVGIEFAGHHGFTLGHDLRRRGYVIVNVLPSVTKRFKEVEDNSPRKDDAKDAAQICKLLEAGLFVGFPALDELAAELRLLTTERQRLTVDETRLRNRLLSVLDLAWPEFAGFFCTIAKPTALALLGQWPLPRDLAGATPRTVHRGGQDRLAEPHPTPPRGPLARDRADQRRPPDGGPGAAGRDPPIAVALGPAAPPAPADRHAAGAADSTPPGRSGPHHGAGRERRVCGHTRRGARDAGDLRIAAPGLEARRHELGGQGEWHIRARADQADQARAAGAAPTALLAGGALVHGPGPLPGRVSGAPGPQWRREDERDVRHRPEARAPAAAYHADRGHVR